MREIRPDQGEVVCVLGCDQSTDAARGTGDLEGLSPAARRRGWHEGFMDGLGLGAHPEGELGPAQQRRIEVVALSLDRRHPYACKHDAGHTPRRPVVSAHHLATDIAWRRL